MAAVAALAPLQLLISTLDAGLATVVVFVLCAFGCWPCMSQQEHGCVNTAGSVWCAPLSIGNVVAFSCAFCTEITQEGPVGMKLQALGQQLYK
jgi:hypothetical protein